MILAAISAAVLAAQPVAGRAEEPTPTVPAHAWFSTDDYPGGAMARGAQGVAGFRVEVAANGLPASCTIETTSDDSDLDRATCEIVMSRARFHPARNGDGRAVAGTYRSRVNWVLPEDHTRGTEQLAALAAPYRLEATIGTGADGGTTCSVTVNGVLADLAGVCAGLEGFEGAGTLRRIGRDAAIVLVISVGLEGDPPAAAPRGQDELISEATASLRVDARGRVIDCHPDETDGDRERGAVPNSALCGFPGLRNETLYPAGEDGAERTGRLRLATYLRRGTTRSND